MYNVFEKPWALLFTAVIVLLVMLMVRRKNRDSSRRQELSLFFFLAATAFGLDLLVKTDTEKINAVIHTAVKAVENEEPDAIEPIISANYRDSYHNTKKALMHHCKATLSPPLVEKNITRILAIEIPPPKTTATATFTVRIVFDKQSYVYQSFRRIMLAKLKLHLQKQNDKSWLIDRAELLEIDTQPVKWENVKQVNW
jgi:hypothetical protein